MGNKASRVVASQAAQTAVKVTSTSSTAAANSKPAINLNRPVTEEMVAQEAKISAQYADLLKQLSTSVQETKMEKTKAVPKAEKAGNISLTQIISMMADRHVDNKRQSLAGIAQKHGIPEQDAMKLDKYLGHLKLESKIRQAKE